MAFKGMAEAKEAKLAQEYREMRAGAEDGLMEPSRLTPRDRFAPLPEMVGYLNHQLMETSDMLAKLRERLGPVLVDLAPSDEELAGADPGGKSALAMDVDVALQWVTSIQAQIRQIDAHAQV